MRSLIVTENISVDGVIEATGGWFSPSGSADADEVAELLPVQRSHREAADALLVGRKTFESFRGYWPAVENDFTGTSEYLDRVAKYVLSSTLTEPGWRGSSVLRGRLSEEVLALKAAPGKDIVITGSISVVHALNGTGLIDEYRLWMYPVVLGRGARLFPNPAAAGALQLVEATGFRSGIVLLRYLRQG